MFEHIQQKHVQILRIRKIMQSSIHIFHAMLYHLCRAHSGSPQSVNMLEVRIGHGLMLIDWLLMTGILVAPFECRVLTFEQYGLVKLA